MTGPHSTTDDIAEAKRLLEIYGSDLNRWPADARARWGDIAMSAALEKDRADADALDGFLRAATAPKTPHDLKNRIEAGYRPPAEKAGGASRGLAGLSALSSWIRPLPAGAFASMAALGFAAAAVVDATGDLPPEYEAYAYMENSGLAAFDEDTGATWDAE